jgi:hypothetical protein
MFTILILSPSPWKTNRINNNDFIMCLKTSKLICELFIKKNRILLLIYVQYLDHLMKITLALQVINCETLSYTILTYVILTHIFRIFVIKNWGS